MVFSICKAPHVLCPIVCECIHPCKAQECNADILTLLFESKGNGCLSNIPEITEVWQNREKGSQSPRLNILTTGPPILLSYRLKPVFITLEDMENYLEVNCSRNSSKTHKEFPGW